MTDLNPSPIPPPAVAPQKKGMSGCAIASIILGVLLLVLVGLSVWAYLAFKDNFSAEPAKVEAMADEIAEMELGENWTPQLSMDLLVVRMALFVSEDGQGMAVLMDGGSNMGTGEQFESQMRAEMEKGTQNGGDGAERTTQISSERKELLVRGKPTNFLVVHSEGTESEKKFLEVSGTFDSATSGRTAFLMIKAPEESVAMEEIEAAIQSIK